MIVAGSLAVLAPWMWLATASAHEPGLSRLVVEPDRLRWVVATAEAADPAWLAETRVRRGDAPCTLADVTTTPSGPDGVEHVAAFSCPSAGTLVVDAAFLGRLNPGHRTVLEAEGQTVRILDAAHAEAELPAPAAAPPGALGVAGEYVVLGVEHILTGWDHLLFLTGLLLGVRRTAEAAAVVTGFTLAHSVTLALAALKILVLPASVVEPAIALTVVWVGVENLLPENPARRVALTSTLGLVHGLGFAGLLAELGLPDGQLVPALVSFNVGVELGQFAVVLLVLPILSRLRAGPVFQRGGQRWASLAVSLVGLGWFVERVW